MSKSTKQILNEAADYIEKIDWYQGDYTCYKDGSLHYEDDTCGRCALGAIFYVEPHPEIYDQFVSISNEYAYRVFEKYLYKNTKFDSIHKFNDCSATTKEDVIQALRNCAKELSDE